VLAGQPVTPQHYPGLLADAFGPHADQIQAQYPLVAYQSPSQPWATVLTDRMWARSTFEQHRQLAGHVPVYASSCRPARADVAAVPQGVPARSLPRRRRPLPVPDQQCVADILPVGAPR
jgi:hypothetical protein